MSIIVRYCLSVYGSCGTTQIRRVQKIVNFCVRVVTGKRRYDRGVTRACTLLRWLSAEQLVAYHTACALGRIIVSEQPSYLYSTIGPRARQRHAYETRVWSALAP